MNEFLEWLELGCFADLGLCLAGYKNSMILFGINLKMEKSKNAGFYLAYFIYVSQGIRPACIAGFYCNGASKICACCC
ncbi:MAG: hypothetical protein ACOYWZ_04670 [Bacillota bacterium]